MNEALIVHVVPDLKIGGVTSVLLNLLKSSVNSEFTYVVINLSGKGDTNVLKRLNDLRINIFNFDYKFEEGYDFISYFKRAFFSNDVKDRAELVINKIKELNPRVIHFHTLPSELRIGHKLLALADFHLFYTDHVCRIHKSELSFVKRLLYSIVFSQFYKKYHVIAVGPAVLDYLNFLYLNKSVKSCKIINNKIEERNNRILYKQNNLLRIIYVSRISSVKGHVDLVNAWEMLPFLNIELVMVGPDEMNGKLHDYISERKFNNRLSIMPPTNNVLPLLLESDLAVFPSHKEGLPIALLEKMQVGLPCIVSDIEEIKVITTHGDNVYMYPCGDVNKLAEAIICLVSNFQLRQKIGLSAAEYIRDNFSEYKSSLQEDYEAYYKSILD